jgi:putative SOS response-associated peptidase YedK
LIPSWAKDRSIATKTINAMSGTAAEKPAFRDALRLRRCLIPASSFYEWQSIGLKQKQPFSIGMADDSTFAFAGLWDSWTDPGGDIVETCTILTTTPNALVAGVHNRMLVILRVDDYARWLDPSINNPSSAPASSLRFRSDEKISSQHSCEPARERRPRMRAGSSHRNHCNVVLISRSQSVAIILESVLFFHNSIHRNLVFTLIFALTSFQQLFSLCGVDG